MRRFIALIAAQAIIWSAPSIAQMVVPPLPVVSSSSAPTQQTENPPPQPSRQGFDVRRFNCPLGGKAFEQEVGYSAFPLITLPDGSWLGDTEIGVQIPVCPDNGLVLVPDLTQSAEDDEEKILYADYSANERAQLPALIADPEYLALKADGPYAQAYWLATKLGRPAVDRFFMLQRSTWATRDPVTRKRLVARFAADAPGVAELLKDGEQRQIALFYVVNALRELGRFEEALVLLNQIDGKSDAELPSGSPYDGTGPQNEVDKMRLAIAAKDDGRFAAELLPTRMVIDICENKLATIYGPTTPATLAGCKARQAREQGDSDAFEGALTLLHGDTPALDQSCAATPKDKRNAALDRACAIRQDDLDKLAANALSANGPALAAACDTGTADTRTNVMRHACNNYHSALGWALGDALGDDDAAYALFCPAGDGDAEDGMDERESYLISACVSARSLQKTRAKEVLLADPVALALRCKDQDKAATGNMQAYEVLLSACSTLESNRESLGIEQLATQPAAFAARCDRYARTNASDNDVNVDWRSEAETCRSAWRLRENTRAKAAAEAKGLRCFGDVIYSPTRPECVTPAEYASRMAPAPDRDSKMMNMSWMDKGTSLMNEAEARAQAMITRAKEKKAEGAPTRISVDKK